MTKTTKKTWEEPKLIVHGDVVQITQGCDKTYGENDGFTFMGQTIKCSS